LLLQVEQVGAACHTDERSCFHNPISLSGEVGKKK
jgi:phosphoribosyl-AMP cyclohydrolase